MKQLPFVSPLGERRIGRSVQSTTELGRVGDWGLFF